MSDVKTLNEYINSFPIIGANIADGLEELLDELETHNPHQKNTLATNIIIQAAQLQALQAIAIGIANLAQKES
jgi:hypothetical protein